MARYTLTFQDIGQGVYRATIGDCGGEKVKYHRLTAPTLAACMDAAFKVIAQRTHI
jgi:hypothetical protein